MVSTRVYGALSVVLGVVLLASNFYFGNAAHCYECNSHNDAGCDASTPPDSYKTNCTAKHNESFVLCRKAVLNTEYGPGGRKGGETRIIRSCGWDVSSYADSCYRRTGTGWVQMTCSCSEDYCNSAPRISFTYSSIGVLLLCVVNFL